MRSVDTNFVWHLTDRHQKTLTSRTKRSSTRVLYSFWVVSYGLAVTIAGFHTGGPGLTPSMGTSTLCFKWHDRMFY